MINWDLLSIRNVVVIGVIAIAWHVILTPVFASLSNLSPDNG